MVSAFEPEDRALFAGALSLDRVAGAFAKVVDAKSPWTYRHSRRVAEIAVGIGGLRTRLARTLMTGIVRRLDLGEPMTPFGETSHHEEERG